jgi:type III secretion protein C
MIDVPVAMIEIEARIIDIEKTKLTELGFDWAVAAKNASFVFGDPGRAASAGDFALGINARVSSNTVILSGSSYLLSRIQALESAGDAQVIARPSILTTDNLGALIDLSQTFYASVSGERVANLVPVTVGTMLKVTPHLIEREGQRQIQMVVDIEDGTLVSREGLSLPVVKKSTLATQAVILENQSLLIGGYNMENAENALKKIPLLSDLPVVGQLFTTSYANREKYERLFLITPRIVDPLALASAGIPALAEKDANRATIPAPIIDLAPSKDLSPETSPVPAADATSGMNLKLSLSMLKTSAPERRVADANNRLQSSLADAEW